MTYQRVLSVKLFGRSYSCVHSRNIDIVTHIYLKLCSLYSVMVHVFIFFYISNDLVYNYTKILVHFLQHQNIDF